MESPWLHYVPRMAPAYQRQESNPLVLVLASVQCWSSVSTGSKGQLSWMAAAIDHRQRH